MRLAPLALVTLLAAAPSAAALDVDSWIDPGLAGVTAGGR